MWAYSYFHSNVPLLRGLDDISRKEICFWGGTMNNNMHWIVQNMTRNMYSSKKGKLWFYIVLIGWKIIGYWIKIMFSDSCKCKCFLPHPSSHPHPDEGHGRKKESGVYGEGDEKRERKGYLCVGHLGRALSPKAQQDGENRERVSETEMWAEDRQIERERKGIDPTSTLLLDRSVKVIQLWCIWGSQRYICWGHSLS